MIERTFVAIKHDGVQRGLVGEIIKRFEQKGIKIAALKLVHADDNKAKNHYSFTEEWAKPLYDRTKEGFEKQGKPFPFKDHMEYAKMIQSFNINYLQEGPVITMVLESPNVVEIVRKIIGHTEPRQAILGTIRGDFATDSYTMGNDGKRAVRNLMHASGDVKEAEREIALWFTEDEIHDYKKEDWNVIHKL